MKIKSISEKVERFKIDYGFGILPEFVIIEPGDNEINAETYNHLVGDADFNRLLHNGTFTVVAEKVAKSAKDVAA